jgi:2-oxoisovalerate dehydrogenase E1 component
LPTTSPLSPEPPWVELKAGWQDWRRATPALLGDMLTQLHLIRAFEEGVLELAGEGLIHGPAHASIGQEGGAVGSISALRPGDQINGSHRGHHQFLAKALRHVTGDLSPTTAVPVDVRATMTRTLAEIMGLRAGFSGGRGGSMHLRWREAGALGTNAIVGGGVPMAAGAAWAQRQAGSGSVVVTYFGDGAVNIGSVLETMNLAAAWRLPLIFFIENNHYAVSTTVEESTAEPRLSSRGPGFGIPSWRVDGMNPLAVRLATEAAVQRARNGEGPAVIEADVYRYFHQNGPLPGSAFGYRTKAEEARWRARDPLDQVGQAMVRRELLTQGDLIGLRSRAQAVVAEIISELTEPTEGNRRTVRQALWPDPALMDAGLRSDLSELADLRTAEQPSFAGKLEARRFVDVIADVAARRMEQDPGIVVLGEDVHKLKGGTNGATRGLKDRFPDRVMGTPISENAFVGLAGGIAMDGRFKPIVEFMYPDFMWVAADQVFNQIGKMRHMFGGEIDIPLVLRTKVAIGTGYGSQHSMDPAGVFATAPGWRIAAPSTAFDYVGMMNAALACRDPVLMIEHVDLYQRQDLAPVDDLDFIIPPGQAAVRRGGSRGVVITYGCMVHRTLEAIEDLGADVEVVDLRWLDRASVDWDTIATSVQKTNNVLIVEQGARGTSYGAWLADELHRRLFDWLDQPIMRLTGGDASPTISKILERAAYPGREDVARAIEAMLSGSG